MTERPALDERARPSVPATTAQHAVAALRRAIVAGELRPGDRVRQEELADRIGVSIAPVREALAVLEQEGQVSYRPRRGYFVTELDIENLREIYELREMLEDRAARRALPLLEDEALQRLELASRECANAAVRGDVTAELEANRRFHFTLLESPDQRHTMRLIRLLWDSTEAYRAMYYNAPQAQREAIGAHQRILAAVLDRDPKQLVAELDAHRSEALALLTIVLAPT